MSEASHLLQLREAAPAAPERLHELVRALPATRPRRSVRMRPALVTAVGVAIAVAVGAAAVGGLSGSRKQRSTNQLEAATGAATAAQSRLLAPTPKRAAWRASTSDKAFAPQIGA